MLHRLHAFLSFSSSAAATAISLMLPLRYCHDSLYLMEKIFRLNAAMREFLLTALRVIKLNSFQLCTSTRMLLLQHRCPSPLHLMTSIFRTELHQEKSEEQ
jgi:hypothetical protein